MTKQARVGKISSMMGSMGRWAGVCRHAFARGTFPHEMSFILESRWRNLLLSPEALAQRLPLTGDSCVLEIGAGSGFYSSAVASRIPRGRLELVDLQEEMLAKARRKVSAAGLGNVGCSVTRAGEPIPFPDASFDVVFMVTVLGEVDDKDSLINDACRLLAPGGVLSLSEHLPDPDFVLLGRLRRLVEPNGFEFRRKFGRRWAFTANFERV